jgi:hypothetical protein
MLNTSDYINSYAQKSKKGGRKSQGALKRKDLYSSSISQILF